MTDVSQIIYKDIIRNKNIILVLNIQRKMSNTENREGGRYLMLSARHKRIIEDYMEKAIEDNMFVSLKLLMHSIGTQVCVNYKLVYIIN